MKVAIVTSFPRDRGAPRGGVEAVSVNLVNALAFYKDLDIHVVTTDPGILSIESCELPGFLVHRLPEKKMLKLLYALYPGRKQLSLFLKELAPDIVHSHDFYGIMTSGINIPKVFTIHGFIHADTLMSGTRFSFFRSFFWKKAEELAWKDQSRIISISPYVKEKLESVGIKGRVREINNPVDPDYFNVSRKEEKGVIFSSAVICPRKNTIGLIKAFSYLIEAGVNAELRLAGESQDTSYFEQVKNYINEKKLSNKVKFLGRLDKCGIMEELEKASVYALLSFEENAPIGIEEAMAAGVPVVSSNCCGMPYMVRNGLTGFLVDPNDNEGAALKFREILQNDSVRGAMSVNSRIAAEEDFHPDVVAAKTRKLYLEVACQGKC